VGKGVAPDGARTEPFKHIEGFFNGFPLDALVVSRLQQRLDLIPQATLEKGGNGYVISNRHQGLDVCWNFIDMTRTLHYCFLLLPQPPNGLKSVAKPFQLLEALFETHNIYIDSGHGFGKFLQILSDINCGQMCRMAKRQKTEKKHKNARKGEQPCKCATER
jgi:hypothetical protein